MTVDSEQDAPRLYKEGEYAKRHPTWHAEDSQWKAQQVLRILERNGLRPRKVCEVGSGAGEILRQLQLRLPEDALFVGYEISPDAHKLALTRAGPRLDFKLADFLEDPEEGIELLLLMDVVEHVEDYLAFLRRLRTHSEWIVLHIPLDLSVEWLLRDHLLLDERRSVGHLHYFTKELALEVLRDTGYELHDWFYTRWAIELCYPTWRSVATSEAPLKAGVRKLIHHAVFAVDPDLCASLVRGCSLLVLAKGKDRGDTQSSGEDVERPTRSP